MTITAEHPPQETAPEDVPSGLPFTPTQRRSIERLCKALDEIVPDFDTLDRRSASALIATLVAQQAERNAVGTVPTEQTFEAQATLAPDALFGGDDPFSGPAAGDDPLDEEIDLNRPEGGLIPVGLAGFQITDLTVANGPSGYPNIRMQAECLTGEGKGLTQFENLSLSPKARFRLNQFLDALQLPRTGKLRVRSLRGKQFWAEITHEDSDQGKRSRVQQYVIGPAIEVTLPAPQGTDRVQAHLGAEFE